MNTPNPPPYGDNAVEAEIRRQMEEERRRAAPFSPDIPPPNGGFLGNLKSKGGVLGGIASVLIAVLKFLAPVLSFLGKFKFLAFLLKSKILLTAGSMLLTIGLEAMYYGWPMAVGIVALIFLHECGHALASIRLGHGVSGMIFVPFMGAVVFSRRGGTTVTQDAFVGIMGPVAGAFVSFLCIVIFALTGARFWLALASIGFSMNLFNLLPTVPLDGGWIVPVFSPRVMAIGAVLLIPLSFLNPLILVLAIVSLPRIVRGWKADPRDTYFQATAAERWKYGAAYLALIAFLAAGSTLGHRTLNSTDRPLSAPGAGRHIA